jgi:DNA-binding PadR family transcriptional regulator
MPKKINSLYAETLILLKIWDLAKSDVTKSNFVPSSKSDAYKQALERLETENALSSKQKNKRSKVYSLTDEGKQRLAKGMTSEDFEFIAQVGSKTANSVLKWFRLNCNPASSKNVETNGQVPTIQSYEEFSDTVLKIHGELDRDYNLGNLVPIYRIRRELGERVSRSQFNEWLLEVQANDHVQLMGGEMPNVTQDQLEDSLSIPGGGLRFYVKSL